ncbi:MAG TPA: HPr family phosphocarrier protein [Calditrichia bacterium]|nr:HPr family phosphocarrier protein [Calditrichota bacterium]HQU71153.1 HPr family phosphocarrier protein [Calditrichia bacterium]HQV33227.1 HPr family phosphocarrier protein [Calditrichia bacterium]
MIRKEFTILNKYGLHARPAAQMVKTTGKFKSSIKIEKDGLTADGKSIMGLMTLAAEVGSTITVIIDGEDADQALSAIADLIQNKFYED